MEKERATIVEVVADIISPDNSRLSLAAPRWVFVITALSIRSLSGELSRLIFPIFDEDGNFLIDRDPTESFIARMQYCMKSPSFHPAEVVEAQLRTQAVQ